MLRRSKLEIQDGRVDQVCGELLRAVKVSEDEVAATAGAPDLYDRVRLRIAEIGERASWRRSIYERLPRVNASLLNAPRFLVLSGAVAILLLLGMALFVLLGPSSTRQIAQPQGTTEPAVPSAAPPVERLAERNSTPAVTGPTPDKSRMTSHRRRVDSRSSEVATDFLPLTFDDSTAQESGHVVRMKVPRSALIAFGVPMNMERAGEFITADVVIGDDGLARAIRFVQ